MIQGMRAVRLSVLVAAVFSLPAFAKCPLSETATVVVRAAVGDLHVDTSGREATAEVQVDNNLVQVQETCGKDVVEFTNNQSDPRGVSTWRIITPKAVHLDLVTMAGNIVVGDVNGHVLIRTAGGAVTVGNIRGSAAIVTQGGSIKSGSVAGDAEMRSQGGTVEAGDIGGNADLHATAGVIRVGNIGGSATLEAGRTISIVKAGEVKATTNAGDISIGAATRIDAKSGGGNITISRRVSGPFEGHTEAGDIWLESAASWVEASTRRGNIFVRMVPDNLDGDLHMDLDAGVGDVTVYLPPRLRATVDASVQRAAFQSPGITSEFPTVPVRPPQGLIPNRFYSETHSASLLNGGGNKIVLHTALGKITIKKN